MTGRETTPDANLRAMIRERRPDLTDADLDALLAPVNEAGAALAGREASTSTGGEVSGSRHDEREIR